MGLINAERQRRYRERRAVGEPVWTFQRPQDRRSRPRRWADALAKLRTLQAEYGEWRDQLPEALADSRTAERLDEVCDVDLDALDVEPPPRVSVGTWDVGLAGRDRSPLLASTVDQVGSEQQGTADPARLSRRELGPVPFGADLRRQLDLAVRVLARVYVNDPVCVCCRLLELNLRHWDQLPFRIPFFPPEVGVASVRRPLALVSKVMTAAVATPPPIAPTAMRPITVRVRME